MHGTGTTGVVEGGGKPIEETEVGDKLMTGGEYYSSAAKTWRCRADSLVQLEAGGSVLRVTPDHLVLVERKGELLWCEPGSLIHGDTVVL